MELLRANANARFGEGQCTPEVDIFLGIRCSHDHELGIFRMDVESKVIALLNDLSLAHLNSTEAPYHAGLCKLDVNVDEGQKFTNLTPTFRTIREHYASICGSCIYLAVTCRPDISTICKSCVSGNARPYSTSCAAGILYVNISDWNLEDCGERSYRYGRLDYSRMHLAA